MYVIVKFFDYTNLYNQIIIFMNENPIKHREINKLEYKNVSLDEMDKLINYIDTLNNEIRRRIILKIKYHIII